MLRRMLAIALLIAFELPFAAPLLAASTDSDSHLPACCRRHGKHHCTMGTGSGISTEPGFQAPPCPFYPAAATQCPVLVAALAAHPQSAVRIQRGAAEVFGRDWPTRIFTASAHLKRGPPARLG